MNPRAYKLARNRRSEVRNVSLAVGEKPNDFGL